MKIKQFLIAACIGSMFTACNSRDDYGEKAPGAPITFKAGIENVVTRAIDDDLQTTSFLANEQISVFVTESGTSTNISDVPADGYWTYKIGSDKATMTLVSGTTPQFPSDGTAIDVYALYPKMGKETSFTINQDQTSLANYRASDLMYASAIGKKVANGTIELTFKHCLSKLVISLQAGNTGLTQEQLSSAATAIFNWKGKVQITHDGNKINLGAISQSGAGPLTMYNNSGTFYAVMLPGNTGLSFKTNISGVVYSCDLSDVELAEGAEHNITMTLGAGGTAKIKSIGISPWIDGTDYNDKTATTE